MSETKPTVGSMRLIADLREIAALMLFTGKKREKRE